MSSPLKLLPDELILKIFSKVSAKDRSVLSLVSRRFHKISLDLSLWKSVIVDKMSFEKAQKVLERCTLLDRLVTQHAQHIVTAVNSSKKLRSLQWFYVGPSDLDELAVSVLNEKGQNLRKLTLTVMSIPPDLLQLAGKCLSRITDLAIIFNLED